MFLGTQNKIRLLAPFISAAIVASIENMLFWNFLFGWPVWAKFIIALAMGTVSFFMLKNIADTIRYFLLHILLTAGLTSVVAISIVVALISVYGF